MKPYIFLKIDIVLIVLALSCFSQTAIAQGNLVVNGSFNISADGWTTNTSSGYYNPLKGNPGGCFILDSSSSPLTPMIGQTINGLVSGFSYLISGDYSIEGGNIGSTPSFGVAMDGIFLFEVAPANYNWQSFSFLYTATSSSAVLSLAAQINGTDDAYRIDNISMQAVPEPGSLCLIGVGGILSALFFRNRRKGCSCI